MSLTMSSAERELYTSPDPSQFNTSSGRRFANSRRWQLWGLAAVFLSLLLSLHKLESSNALLSRARELGASKFTSPKHVKFYIYELPDEISKDVWSKPTTAGWLNATSEYDGDIWVYHSLANSPYRTYNPDEASLFYVPVFPTHYQHQIWSEYSWPDVQRHSTLQVLRAISLISTHFPYWNRTNGGDHFLTITGDQGRCDGFRGMKAQDFGDMFVIQHHGDVVAFHKEMPGPGDTESQVTQEDAWPCYRPERDIILPTYLPEKDVPPYPVYASSPRNISVLYSFQAGGFASQRAFRNVRVRDELRKYWEIDPPLGNFWPAKRYINETIDDMAHSVFCVTPPGLVAHTSRFYRAIQRGCIPIHFMSAYDLPFQSQLDYDSFSIRLHPHNIGELSNQVANLLNDKPHLKRMQNNLQRVQEKFTWERAPGKLSGVDELLLGELDRAYRRLQEVHQYLA